MYTFSVRTYNKHGFEEPIDNLVVLKHWKDVYTFSTMFRNSLASAFGDNEIQSYTYLDLSVEITEYLLCNHGGYKLKSTIEEQCEFLGFRFVNVLGVKYPWINTLEQHKLIRRSKDLAHFEWIDPQIAALILNEFNCLYWFLESKAKKCFKESERIVNKQELLDHIKSVYAIIP